LFNQETNDIILYKLIVGDKMFDDNWGGQRTGSGRNPLQECEKKKGVKIYITDILKEDIIKYGIGNSFSEKTVEVIKSEIQNRKNKKK